MLSRSCKNSSADGRATAVPTSRARSARSGLEREHQLELAFKGDDAWMALNVKDGKLFKSGELRYLPEKKLYRLTATDKSDKKLVFEGKIESNVLKLERLNPDTKATEQITMNTAAEGDRFIYHFAHKNEGTTIWRKDYLIACTREGVSLGKVNKKNECVVSGGLGTIAISYKGGTYYVCCSGSPRRSRKPGEVY